MKKEKSKRKQNPHSLCYHYQQWIIIFLFFMLFTSASHAGYQINFIPKISTSLEHTDNLLLSNEDPLSDFITVISPGFTAQVAGKTNKAELSYDLGHSYYDRYPDNNAFRHNAKFSSLIEFSRHTRLNIQNTFLFTEEPVPETQEFGEAYDPSGELIEYGVEQIADEHITEQETVRKERQSFYTNTANLLFTHQFGKSDIVTIRYNYDILENKDVTVEDKSSHKPSFYISYWPLPYRLGLRAGFSYIKDDFSGTPDEPASWEESINPSLGMIYWVIPRQVSVETNFSYKKGDFSDTPEEPDQWYENINPSVNLFYWSLPYKLGLETGISYTKGVSSPTGESFDSEDNFDNWSGHIALSKKFTRHFEGSVQYTHTIMDFRGDTEEDYNLYEPSVGIKYIIAEDVPLSLGIGYIIRDRAESGSESAVSIKGDLGKSWRFSRYGSLNFKATSGYDEAYLGAKRLGFGTYNNIMCKAIYEFTKYLSGDIYGAYQRNKYTESEEKRDDKTREAGSNLTFYMKKNWLLMRLGYSYRSTDSTLDKDSYDESRIRFEITLTPPRPLRTVH